MHRGIDQTAGAGIRNSGNQSVTHVEWNQDSCCFCLCHGLRDGCGDFSKHGVSDDYANGTDNDIRGFTGDNAATFPVGEISEEAKKLLKVTKESLEKAVEVCIAGNRLGDIGSAVQGHVESNGFSVVREYVGHGVGRDLHEDPEVPNYGRAGHGVRLVPGMTIAIEPMVNAGGPEVEVLANDWTVVTVDRQLSAHFEYTVAITESGPVIMTRV